MKYASFGKIVFQVYSYKEHTETNEYAVAKLQTVIAPSSLQYLGNELQSLELTINFHNAFCDPLEEYQNLKDLAKKGDPQKLIIGEKVFGDYVIDSIEAQYQKIDAYGKPVAITLHVKFTQYIAKTLQKRNIKTTKNPKAVKKKG
jgi:phage protein U